MNLLEEKCFFLYGPNGIGKTSLVYSISEELNYKILEFNAATVRLSTGMFQKQLFESVQSYCISNNYNKISNLFASKSRPNNQKNSNEKLFNSLILFDDIDAIIYENSVFTQFWRTFKQLLIEARKPIVITSRIEPNFLTNELTYFKITKLNLIDKDFMFNYIENIFNKNNYNSNTVDLNIKIQFDGDMRKLINQLQFWFADTISYQSIKSHIENDFQIEYLNYSENYLSMFELYSLNDVINAQNSNTFEQKKINSTIELLDKSNHVNITNENFPNQTKTIKNAVQLYEEKYFTIQSSAFKFDFINFFDNITQCYPKIFEQCNDLLLLQQTRSKRKRSMKNLPLFL